jgi:hypothetical protein
MVWGLTWPDTKLSRLEDPSPPTDILFLISGLGKSRLLVCRGIPETYSGAKGAATAGKGDRQFPVVARLWGARVED